MGVVGAYGKIARSLDDRDPKRRRSARVVGALIFLPVCVALVILIVSLSRG
jgi:hypothetical protein